MAKFAMAMTVANPAANTIYFLFFYLFKNLPRLVPWQSCHG
jgi:hypothetical protein